MKTLVVVVSLFVCLNCVFAVYLVKDQHTEHEKDEQENHKEGNYTFESLLNKVNSESKEFLDEPTLQKVLNDLNVQCLSAHSIFEILKVPDETGLNENQFKTATILIAANLVRNSTNCTDPTPQSLDAARSSLFHNDVVCQADFETLLDIIQDSRRYISDDEAENVQCFSSATLLQECTSDRNTTDEAIEHLVLYLAHGFCILPEPLHFQTELLEYLNADTSGFVTKKNFEKLLLKFNLMSSSHGSHNDSHNHGAKQEKDKRGENHESTRHGDHDHDGDTDHDNEITSKRRKRNLDDHDEHENKCYSASQLLTIAGSSTNSDGEMGLTSAALTRICPAILQQFVTDACKEEHRRNASISRSYTQAEKYGYGTLSVLLISLLAFGGLLLFPSIGSFSYQMIMQFFIALGVGTLSGDALLHLIPEFLGLHGHGESDGHDHAGEKEDKSHLFKLLVTVAGIYLFYLFENILRLYKQLKNKDISPHQHHHNKRRHSHAVPGQERSKNHIMTRASISIAINNAASATKEMQEENGGSQMGDLNEIHEEDDYKPDAVCCGVTAVGIMVFIGDALHNLGDGLALGVAFSASPISGFGASIAIFCHELPHEFGDFAIYLKNGMTKWQGLAMNFLAACFAFIGLYIGLSVGENEAARQWMLAVIAGMFLYIALVDVLHEMIEEESEDHPFLLFIVQNLGLVLGWIILFLLAMYEDDLHEAFA